MAWRYTDPLSSDKDTVRYLVGDTDEHDPLTQDEEILWQLQQYPEVRQAAVAVAQQLATKFARYASVRNGDTQVDWNARAQQYRQIAQDLQAQTAALLAIPYAGGISQSDKQSVLDNTDRVHPSFTTRLHDSAGAFLSSADDEEGTP